VRDRKRWKTEFDLATLLAAKNVSEVSNLMNGVLEQNSINTHMVKMVLDILMISQLLEKQETIDKKQIGMFGLKNHREILEPH
jgi:hypothetical protein